MFAHNKRLQYTVRVSETNPGRDNGMSGASSQSKH